MKKYMFLHFGFEKPTQEIMDAWGKWFDLIADKQIEQGGFHGDAFEVSSDGTKDLSRGPGAITGYNIIRAESLDEAKQLAEGNPFIDSVRVYEIK